jgi:hypothetical protein
MGVFDEWTPLILAISVPLFMLAWLLGRITQAFRRRRRRGLLTLVCRACGEDLLGDQPANCPRCGTFRPAETPEVLRLHRLGLCPACGYDLRATHGPTCPECGAHRRPTRWEDRLTQSSDFNVAGGPADDKTPIK